MGHLLPTTGARRSQRMQQVAAAAGLGRCIGAASGATVCCTPGAATAATTARHVRARVHPPPAAADARTPHARTPHARQHLQATLIRAHTHTLLVLLRPRLLARWRSLDFAELLVHIKISLSC
jgi:hypothetical protein